LKMKIPAGDFIEAARGQGLIVLPAGENVVRLLPPLTLSESEAREGIALMDHTAALFEERKAAAQ
jgi:acetylornithine/N-succinyldiaminopimelate aminotransferase